MRPWPSPPCAPLGRPDERAPSGADLVGGHPCHCSQVCNTIIRKCQARVDDITGVRTEGSGMLAATSVSCTLGLVIGCASLWHQMSRVQSELTSRHLRVARTGAEPTLGTRIRDARVARGLGVRELARIADCSASLVSQIERGRANPSVSTLYSLADALGISVASLFRSGDGRSGAPDEGRSAAPYAALLEAPSTARRPSTIEEAVVLRRAQRRSIDLERGVHWELLLPRPERDVDFLEVR